mmetsp:Transcript_7703/g.11597  ORF Transcript_7703/g.11597 Transcript_7703/m.11597 type:complete len:81 (+) Transcript_7703:57-299(+)
MAVFLRHKLLIFIIIALIFIAFAAWNTTDDSNTAWWAMWTVPVIFFSFWLLMDCMFESDDKTFIFDHDYENWRRRLDPMY